MTWEEAVVLEQTFSEEVTAEEEEEEEEEEAGGHGSKLRRSVRITKIS